LQVSYIIDKGHPRTLVEKNKKWKSHCEEPCDVAISFSIRTLSLIDLKPPSPCGSGVGGEVKRKIRKKNHPINKEQRKPLFSNWNQ
jgi:hypothetical protein